MKQKIFKLRTSIARIMGTILFPTVFYVVSHLRDPEYCPTIGWTLGFIILIGAAMWSFYYGIEYPMIKKED